ncbi:MAG: hypothetical protein ACXITV_07260 [Luteibaculaceae bacterium]
MSRYNSRIQRWVKRLLPTDNLRNRYQESIHNSNYSKWIEQGKPSPPPHIVKVRTIQKFKALTKASILVETGTFMGDMIEAQLHNFDTIYSIELSTEFWENAKIKFQDFPHVQLLQGDSGKVMHQLIKDIEKPAIFWLDGHYSGGNTALGEKISPIYEELEAIFTSPLKHCLLIDDARLFNGTDDYPKKEELYAFIKKHRPNAIIELDADTISVLYHD